MDPSIEDLKDEYLALCHAIQSGVAMMMNYNPKDTQVKHLRVGVNMALADSAALAKLLMAKGVFTELEYWTALNAQLREEKDNYERLVRDAVGDTSGRVTLG